MPVFLCRNYLFLPAPVIDVGEVTETDGGDGQRRQNDVGHSSHSRIVGMNSCSIRPITVPAVLHSTWHSSESP